MIILFYFFKVYLSPAEGAGLFWSNFLSFVCTANSYTTKHWWNSCCLKQSARSVVPCGHQLQMYQAQCENVLCGLFRWGWETCGEEESGIQMYLKNRKPQLMIRRSAEWWRLSSVRSGRVNAGNVVFSRHRMDFLSFKWDQGENSC